MHHSCENRGTVRSLAKSLQPVPARVKPSYSVLQPAHFIHKQGLLRVGRCRSSSGTEMSALAEQEQLKESLKTNLPAKGDGQELQILVTPSCPLR